MFVFVCVCHKNIPFNAHLNFCHYILLGKYELVDELFDAVKPGLSSYAERPKEVCRKSIPIDGFARTVQFVVKTWQE